MGLKALWNTALVKLNLRKEDSPLLEVPRLVAIQGEYEPGVLTVDVAMFNASGEPLLYPTKTVKAKVLPKIRPTVNRVLCGLETVEDEAILEMYILSLPEIKAYQSNPSGV